jgi:hypothetical protein
MELYVLETCFIVGLHCLIDYEGGLNLIQQISWAILQRIAELMSCMIFHVLSCLHLGLILSSDSTNWPRLIQQTQTSSTMLSPCKEPPLEDKGSYCNVLWRDSIPWQNAMTRHSIHCWSNSADSLLGSGSHP